MVLLGREILSGKMMHNSCFFFSEFKKFYLVFFFSVGIVLFEMFYRPLLPGMERISILKTLRNCFFFPDDFATEVPEVIFFYTTH